MSGANEQSGATMEAAGSLLSTSFSEEAANLTRIWKSGSSNAKNTGTGVRTLTTAAEASTSSNSVGACCDVKSGTKRGTSQPKEGDMTILIAKELNQLSMKERSVVYEQLHGVTETTSNEESPESLRELSEKLLEEAKRVRDRSAFDKALFLGPSYVKDPDFLAMFLRADNYDAKLAARRVIRHFQQKLVLFGEERLGRPIVYDDLNDDDKQALYLGRYQLLMQRRDRAGRLIITVAEGCNQYNEAVNMIRVSWYIIMRHLPLDLDAQIKGILVVIYCLDASIYESNDKGVKVAAAPIPRALPMKVMAVHYCYHNAMMIPAMSLIQMLFGMAWRIRFRAHYGSYLECMHSLMTFGIPKEVLPVNSNNGAPLLDEFLAEHNVLVQREREDTIASSGTDACGRIVLPQLNDVLLGRGRPYQEYFGNRKMTMMIQEKKEEYASSGKSRKTELSNIILQGVKQESGGRFLKKTDDGMFWAIVTDDVAREKVSHGFRLKSKSQSESVVSFPLMGARAETLSSDASDMNASDEGSSAKKGRLLYSWFDG